MFSLRFPSIFAAALLLSACGPSTAELGPRAATDLSCAPEKISIQGDHVWVQKASGCGKETVYLYDPQEGKWLSPLDRAAFDLSCPKTELTAQTLMNNDTVGITGCGRKAVYVIARGNWILNTAESQEK